MLANHNTCVNAPERSLHMSGNALFEVLNHGDVFGIQPVQIGGVQRGSIGNRYVVEYAIQYVASAKRYLTPFPPFPHAHIKCSGYRYIWN